MFKKMTKPEEKRIFGRISILTLGVFLIPVGVFAGEVTEEKGSQSRDRSPVSEEVAHPGAAEEVEGSEDPKSQGALRDYPARSDRQPRTGPSETSTSRVESDSNYWGWLDHNPRYSHPIHERVHRNSWSEQVRRNNERASQAQRSGEDPRSVNYEEPRVITYNDITYDPNNWDKFYPFPRSRVIWYNDRYYHGRYYSGDGQGRTDRIQSPESQGPPPEGESQAK